MVHQGRMLAVHTSSLSSVPKVVGDNWLLWVSLHLCTMGCSFTQASMYMHKLFNYNIILSNVSLIYITSGTMYHWTIIFVKLECVDYFIWPNWNILCVSAHLWVCVCVCVCEMYAGECVFFKRLLQRWTANIYLESISNETEQTLTLI